MFLMALMRQVPPRLVITKVVHMCRAGAPAAAAIS
jgi:hypothetical protein